MSTDFAALLHGNRDAGFVFGYGHLLLFPAVAAVGAGLHVAAYVIEHEAHISTATAGGALLVATLAPWVVVLGIELQGRRVTAA